MTTKNTILFSVATALFMIGIHQAMTIGFAGSYWLFMISIGLLLYYKMRKDASREKER